MNIKKYLKQQAKKDHEAILSADDGEMLRSLQAMIDDAPTAKNSPSHFKAWIAGAASALVAIILVCVLVFYPSNAPIIYLEENFEVLDSDMNHLNDDFHEFTFRIDSMLYSAEIKKTIDSISGDILFYETILSSHDTLIRAHIIAVCNKNFTFKNFHETDTLTEKVLPNYTVSYYTQKIPDSTFGIDTLNGYAVIHVGNESVYITEYSELMLDEDGSFLDVIQDIVQLKQTKEASYESSGQS